MRWAPAILAAAALAMAAAPAPASAGLLGVACGAAGVINGAAGKVCNTASHAGNVIKAGKKLLGGHVGGALSALLGGGGGGSGASTAVGLAAVGAWVLGGATFALHETAKLLSNTTRPQLESTWFSSTYWRIAGIAAVLTLPFLFAAAVQALMRSDLALLIRAALGYLPLAFLAVSIAAPLAMLLLAASDQMSAAVASAGAGGAGHFLVLAGAGAGLISLLHGSPFLAFLVGLFTVAGAVVLWIELLAREAAIYVVVLMLPLAFAALVWPARRIWAIRAVEVLMALILSKFAIVAVLALGGAALGHTSGGGVAAMLAGLVLVVMGAFAPWAMLRLLPLAELASGAAGSLRGEGRTAGAVANAADATAHGWARSLTDRMGREGAPDAGFEAAALAPASAAAGPGDPPPEADAGSVGSTNGNGPEGAEAGAAVTGAAAPAAAASATDDDLGGSASAFTHTPPPKGSDIIPPQPTIYLGLDPESGLPPNAPTTGPPDRPIAPDGTPPDGSAAASDRGPDDHDPRPPARPPDEGTL